MANKHSTLTSLFKDIANAIRSKTKATESIKADYFPSYIRDIITNQAGGDAGNYIALKGMIEGTIPGAYTNYSATRVSSYALQDCKLLEEINLTEASYVGQYAFRSCVALRRATFSKATNIMEYAFQNCSALEEVEFDRCTTVSHYAFQNCINLSSIYFPMVETIGSYAFHNCNNLRMISFPKCQTIQSYAFSNCDRLSYISLPVATWISSGAFYNCYLLSEASFPEAIFIGNQCFMNCSELTTISFPNIVDFGQPNLPTNMVNSYSQFAYCIRLENVYMPNYVGMPYATGAFMFCGCIRLSRINLPKIERFPSWYFGECTNLEVVDTPNLNYISYAALINCSKLTSINTLKVSTVESFAFAHCFVLPSLIFDGNPTFSYNGVFLNCSKLSRIEIRGSSLAVLQYNPADVFQNSPFTKIELLGQFGSIYVRPSLLAAYQTAPNWSLMSSRFAALE